MPSFHTEQTDEYEVTALHMCIYIIVHGSLFAYAQHRRQLRSGANLNRFEDIGVDLNVGVRQKLYCMQSVYLNVILHTFLSVLQG